MKAKLIKGLKNTFFAFIPLLVLLLLVEFVFYITTADQYYRQNLSNAISYLAKSDEPERDLAHWEDNTMTIRNEEVGSKLLRWWDKHNTHQTNQKQSVVYPQDYAASTKEQIFIVGCSSAYGYGVRFDSTFGYLLEKKAADRFRVINAGQVGWSSIQLLSVVKRIVDHYYPNTIVLYMSNNEWKNWTNVNPEKKEVAFWHMAKWCTHSYALSYILFKVMMNNTIRDVKKATDYTSKHYQSYNMDYFTGYDYALQNTIEKYDSSFRYAQWEQSKKKYLENFRYNLVKMVEYAIKKNVRVVLMTLPLNYKLSTSWSIPQPMSEHKKGEENSRAMANQIDIYLKTKNWTRADSLLKMALISEPKIAMYHYMNAMLLEQKGELLKARQSYELARETMIGDKGAALSINQIIVEVGLQLKVDVVDIKKLFDEYEVRRGKYFNEDLIEDDCHPNQLGHRIIADELFGLLSEPNTD